MKLKGYLALLIIVLFANFNFTFAQNKYNFDQFFNESKSYLAQPAKWDGNDWLKIGAIGAATVLFMQIDEPVRNELIKDRSYIKSVPIEGGRIWGEVYTTVGISGIYYLLGQINENNSYKKIGFEILQSCIYSALITQSMKMIIGRARPYQNEGAFSFKPLNISGDDRWALPSGHTTLAFSLSTVLAKNSESTLTKIICYIPALLTAASRTSQDKHWISDVFLGAVIGYSVAEFVTSKHEQNESSVIISPSLINLSIPLN